MAGLPAHMLHEWLEATGSNYIFKSTHSLLISVYINLQHMPLSQDLQPLIASDRGKHVLLATPPMLTQAH